MPTIPVSNPTPWIGNPFYSYANPTPWIGNPFYRLSGSVSSNSYRYPVLLRYSPTETVSSRKQRGNYFRGATVPLRFDITSPGTIYSYNVDLFEGRIWNLDDPDTVWEYTYSSGNLIGDYTTKQVVLLPESETEDWGLYGNLAVQLWEAFPGYRKVLANVELRILPSLEE